MKKIFLLAAVAISTFVTTTVNAQDKGRFRIGLGPTVSYAIPKDFQVGVGIGADAQGAYGITENIAAFSQIGYSIFFPKGGEDLDIAGSTHFLAGARYHTTNGFSGGLGIGVTSIAAGGTSGADAYNGFAYSPQVGYSTRGVDFILHYTGVAKNPAFSYIGLKVIFNFVKGRN